jgi:hypothetical protein
MSARKKKYYRDNIKEWQDATNRRLFRKIVAFAALTSIVPGRLHAQPAVQIGDHDLGGFVTSANGPESGISTSKVVSFPAPT